MNESKTPRTDQAIVVLDCDDSCCEIYVKTRDGIPVRSDLVPAELSAQIEAELAASTALSRTLADALDFIAKWNLPKNYELDYGSNGAREYIKGVAERALSEWRAAK